MPAEAPKASVLVFPFDLFGAAGCGAGAERLADFIRELLDDNKRETRPTRCDAYRGLVKLRELAFGTPKAVANWRTLGKQALRHALKAGERAVWLGGNHLSVLPVYEELGADGGAANTLVIQFDAHLDVYQLHDVNPNPANGNFLLHADGPLPAIVNVGHRDLFLLDSEIRQRFAVAHPAVAVALNIDKVAADLKKRADKAARVWIDIDADVFDPSEMPAVHTPLPFGLRALNVLRLLDDIWDCEKVIGLSISEFDPGRDTRDTGLNLLGWLLEWALLRWYEG